MTHRRLIAPTLALCATAAACGEAPHGVTAIASLQPNVVLVTVDTLRPDALGWVAGGTTTPEIDRWAGEGFRFPAAVSPTPLTGPAHATLMTGLVPPRHGVRDNSHVLGAGPSLLAESFAGAGYATAAFVSGFPLTAQFGLDRGFDHYDDRLTAGEEAWLERPATETVHAVEEWLRTAPEPWLLWVHFYDPHYPYEPPPGLAPEGRRGPYDGEVVAVDRAMARLSGLIDTASRRQVLSVFAGDHGESLGEHGEGTHGYFVYDATLLVPVVVRWPGRIEPGESRAGVGLVDLAPTVLDLAGLPIPADIDGRSLTGLLAGEAVAPRAVFIETRQPWTSYGWAPLAGIRSGGWKLIAAPRPELYDLTKDPGEQNNLIDTERARARELRNELDAVLARPATAGAVAADPETSARLAALGYIGGAAPGDEPPPGLPDPKDQAPLRALLTDADAALRRGDLGDALALFASVLEHEPANRFALSRSGAALLQAGRIGEARERLTHAVKVNPDDIESRSALADTLGRSGAYEEAAREWSEVVRRQPRRVQAWSNLGATRGLAGDAEGALIALERALELEPDNPDRLVRLAFAEHAAGRPEAARRRLEDAARLDPDAFVHAGSLGLIALELGDRSGARIWLERSRPGAADFGRARLALARLQAAAGELGAARESLGQALSAEPGLRAEAARDPALAELLRDR